MNLEFSLELPHPPTDVVFHRERESQEVRELKWDYTPGET